MCKKDTSTFRNVYKGPSGQLSMKYDRIIHLQSMERDPKRINTLADYLNMQQKIASTPPVASDPVAPKTFKVINYKISALKNIGCQDVAGPSGFHNIPKPKTVAFENKPIPTGPFQ